MRALAVTAVAAALTACVSLLPEAPPSSVYRLSSPEMGDADGYGQDDVIIRVEALRMPRALSGDAIAMSRDGEIVYIAGARWISPAPRMLQDLIVESIDFSQRGVAAVRPEERVRPDYELHVEVIAFEARYEAAGALPVAEVRMRARLIDARDRRVVAVRGFRGRSTASADRIRAIVAAFDAAAHDSAGSLAEWAGTRTRAGGGRHGRTPES
ncbi:MAG: membrane integrity-associated transporter subunit PqiC [Maricaulaceae bacterium]|nr:membrane integrity-associated transporter subunit PqiC [Maricaulaceae bacterium]